MENILKLELDILQWLCWDISSESRTEKACHDQRWHYIHPSKPQISFGDASQNARNNIE